jgi:hypothetical protein
VVRTLIAVACTFLNVPALMSVVPLVVQIDSGNPADGGLVTAFFSGSAVCAEPDLRRRRQRWWGAPRTGRASGGYITMLRALPPLALVALLLLALNRSPISTPGHQHPG